MTGRNEFLESLIAAGASISVYCDDLSTRGSSHGRKVAKVATLMPVGTGADRWIARTGNRFVSDDRGRSRARLDAAVATERVRADGSVVDPAAGGEFDHLKLVLQCEACGLNVQRRLDARVAELLDRLQAERVEYISLTSLAAMLR